MKNVELREIPECIVDLPNLYFLNLKGSPNVIIPEIIKEEVMIWVTECGTLKGCLINL